ncbi:hypothetical protein BJ508DRAFT_7935 [Ascobolus immersus RN42]|uniref:Uncharacterized protein n=1 Tax=Ascobolus immersus RN42 TaxID=1160509 RepID=A0A3N4IGW0_ASCIM|nr:hypothetical protein BJ508DRAFT_7935 [Ascobolus immersus RN42]
MTTYERVPMLVGVLVVHTLHLFAGIAVATILNVPAVQSGLDPAYPSTSSVLHHFKGYDNSCAVGCAVHPSGRREIQSLSRGRGGFEFSTRTYITQLVISQSCYTSTGSDVIPQTEGTERKGTSGPSHLFLVTSQTDYLPGYFVPG